jgi:hypothetical protein
VISQLIWVISLSQLAASPLLLLAKEELSDEIPFPVRARTAASRPMRVPTLTAMTQRSWPQATGSSLPGAGRFHPGAPAPESSISVRTVRFHGEYASRDDGSERYFLCLSDHLHSNYSAHLAHPAGERRRWRRRCGGCPLNMCRVISPAVSMARRG